MQISSSLKPFQNRTLIVVTNTLKAKIYLAQGIEVTDAGLVDVTSDLEQENSDRESIKIGGSQPTYHSNDEHNTKKEHITKDHFYNALNKNLMHRMQNNEFDSLIFTVPEELENELKESLHVQLLKKTETFIPKNLMNDELLDVVITVQEMPEE